MGSEAEGPWFESAYRLSFLFKSCGLWTLSCDFVPHNYETLKWLSSLPISVNAGVLQWWRQCSDRYIISLSPHLHNPFPLVCVCVLVGLFVLPVCVCVCARARARASICLCVCVRVCGCLVVCCCNCFPCFCWLFFLFLLFVFVSLLLVILFLLSLSLWESLCEQVLFVRFYNNPAPLNGSMQFHYCTLVTREPEQTTLLFWSAACGVTPHGLHTADRR